MKFLKNIAIKRKLKTRNFLNFGAIWINAVLIFLSVSFFASAEPVYINSDTVLNSAYVSGNQTAGHFIINSSNIVINLNSSTLTRNLTWFDGSTIFSSNGFTNVTIKDGTLNWTDWGKLRPYASLYQHLDQYGGFGDGYKVLLFNGFDFRINITQITLSGNCSGSRSVQVTDICRTIESGNTCELRISDVPAPPGYEQDILLCSSLTSHPANYTFNITIDTSIGTIAGIVKGQSYNETSGGNLINNFTLYNDFLLNNSFLRLINVTFNGSKYFSTNFSDSASNLSIGWYLDVQVNDSENNPIANANVTAIDKNSVVRGNGTTDSNGRLRFSLPEYVQNSSGMDWKSNYTITASHGSLSNITQVNLTESKNIYLSLNIDIIPPRITNYELLVQGESPTTANNVFISPNSSIGTKDGVRINVSASEEVNFTIRIQTPEGSLATSSTWVDNNAIQTIRPLTCYWNGTENQCSGNYLPDGIYTINVTLIDMAGNRIENTTKKITIDSTLPQGINATKNQTAIYKNNYVNFSATWTDANLSGYIFSINQTGTWENFSFINFSGNSVSNYTIQINASGRTVVYWKFYAQDLAGNWNSTEEQNFTVLQTLSIFIDRNSWNLGLVPRNTNYTMDSTTRINVTNDGDGNQNYTLRILNVTPNDWNSSSVSALNNYVMSGVFCNSTVNLTYGNFNENGSEDVIMNTPQNSTNEKFASSACGSNGVSVPSLSSVYLWLRFDSPTSVSSKEQHNITIQIGAVAG